MQPYNVVEEGTENCLFFMCHQTPLHCLSFRSGQQEGCTCRETPSNFNSLPPLTWFARLLHLKPSVMCLLAPGTLFLVVWRRVRLLLQKDAYSRNAIVSDFPCINKYPWEVDKYPWEVDGEPQRQTVSLCSTSQSLLKAVLINYSMMTGPLYIIPEECSSV